MENNNNGKGIFYGVIGVATLIVAIIGATFAYFTATTGNNSVINVTSFSEEFAVSLALTKIAPSTAVNSLIPIDSSLMSEALAHTNGESVPQPCIDNNGSQVCAVYSMTLTNTGAGVELIGNLTAETNTYTTTNLKYQLYNCSDSNSDGILDTYAEITGSATADVPTQGNTSNNFLYGTETTSFSLADGTINATTATYCLVMWLSDTGADQSDDLGKTFAGRVTFNGSGSNSGRLQATFN